MSPGKKTYFESTGWKTKWSKWLIMPSNHFYTNCAPVHTSTVTQIFSSHTLFTAGLEGHSISGFPIVWSTHDQKKKKSTVHVLSVYSDSQCNWKDTYFYTLHTRCSYESLEALHKGSNFGMVSTFPLILYFLNFTFWKKERVQHISCESQLHSMCNIQTEVQILLMKILISVFLHDSKCK